MRIRLACGIGALLVAVGIGSPPTAYGRHTDWTGSIAVRWVGGPPFASPTLPDDPDAYFLVKVTWTVTCDDDPNDADALPTEGSWRWTVSRNAVFPNDVVRVFPPSQPIREGNFGSSGDRGVALVNVLAGQVFAGHLHFECDFSNGDKLVDDVVSPLDAVPPYVGLPQMWMLPAGHLLQTRGGTIPVSAKRIPRNRKIFVNLRLGQHLGSNGSFLVRLSGAGVNVKRKLAPADLAKKADLNFIARKAGVIHLSAEIQTDLVGAYHETAPAAHLKSKVVNLVVR